MLDRAWVEEFAHDWIASWNAHDLDRILAHYDDDFEMESPLIVQRLQIDNGRLKGKEAVRSYWASGLKATPQLEFKLIDVAAGVNMVAIVYHSVTMGRTVVETIEFNERGLGARAAALHMGPSADKLREPTNARAE